MNDDFLNKFRKEPKPEFTSALYQRINNSVETRSKHKTLRLTALALSVAAILILTIFLSPSALAFAEGIIRQVGGYVFTQDDVNTVKVPSSIQIYRSYDSVGIQTTGVIPSTTDPANASRSAGFTVLVPAYLPSGYTSMSDWLIVSEMPGVTVSKGYKDGTNNFLIINQLKAADGASQATFHRDQIIDVPVRGQSGVWLPDPSSPDGKEALVWEENGITYWLISNSLSLDEMLKVAESLGQ